MLTTLQDKWFIPAAIIIIAAFAIYFLLKREFRGLIVFIGIAIVVMVLVVYSNDLFGRDGSLTRGGIDLASKVGQDGLN